jgi:hypothetical protein
MPTLDQLINELGEPENVAEMTSQSLELWRKKTDR